jgi:asparagine synthase (glutamine-hydrolysing)
MCGIVGVVFQNKPVSFHGVLDSAVDSMFQRGPDDRGICDILDSSTGTCALFGHRRLSILDVSDAGHQPMSIDNGQITIVYNGEIYNYREIRKELESFGHNFQSNCDTEVILVAYKFWGPDFINRCNGMFAMAIWDSNSKKVWFYRDRVGVKPLYLGFQSDRFYFGSVLSAITKIRGFKKNLDCDAIFAYTWIGYVPGPYSMFDGIEKLLPGHMAVLDLEKWKLEIKPYWQISEIDIKESQNKLCKNADDYTNELESLLQDSVKKCLISDVPLGAFLSGGVDSSVVVSLMHKIQPGSIETFSIGFDVEAYNEAPTAKAVAGYLGTKHHERILSSEDIKQAALTMVSVYDEPFSDSSCLATMLLSQMTRENVTVALSGDGGDELFLGDYYHYRLAEHWKYISRIPRILRYYIGKGISVIPHRQANKISETLLCRNFGDYHYSTQRIWRILQYPSLIPGDIDRVMSKLPIFEASKKLEKCRLSPVHMTSTLDFYSLLPDDFLVKVDRASMAYSLEVRVPLLDHRVVELSRRMINDIPTAYCAHKYLLKKILCRYVPREIWDHPKQGFDVPLSLWFRGDLYGFLRENLLGSRGLPDMFDKNTVLKILEDHKSGRRNNYRMLWSMISLAMWNREYMN